MTLLSTLRRSFAQHAGLPAIRQGDRVVTYAELDRRSAILATRLSAIPADPDAAVVGLLPRGADALVAIVAAIRAGRPFAPLDPGLPPAGLDAALRRLRPCAVVTPAGGPAAPATRPAGAAGTRPPALRGGDTPLWIPVDAAGMPDVPIDRPAPPERPAYLILTSGSTGAAKVVAGSGPALDRYLRWQWAELGHGVGDVFSNIASPWFDFSFKETLAALASGGCTVPAADADLVSGAALAHWLHRVTPTVTCLLPSRFTELLAITERGADESAGWWRPVRQIMISGEALRSDVVVRWQRVVPDGPTLLNMYGPTESTVIKLRHRIPARYQPLGPTVPLGTPIPGTTVELRPAPAAVGETGGTAQLGEICLRGPDLALGYLDGRLEGTTRFADEDGDRLLHTGDLGRRLPDGTIEFISRIDNTIKRRGVMIVAAALEAALVSHPAIRDAAVVVTADTPPVVNLCYVREPSLPRPTLVELRRHLLSRLALAQMPDALREVPALPLTDRGKIDRTALAALLPIRGGGARKPPVRPGAT